MYIDGLSSPFKHESGTPEAGESPDALAHPDAVETCQAAVNSSVQPTQTGPVQRFPSSTRPEQNPSSRPRVDLAEAVARVVRARKLYLS